LGSTEGRKFRYHQSDYQILQKASAQSIHQSAGLQHERIIYNTGKSVSCFTKRNSISALRQPGLAERML